MKPSQLVIQDNNGLRIQRKRFLLQQNHRKIRKQQVFQSFRLKIFLKV